MKIIDILNKMANGTLENGFKFCLEDEVYTYTKGDNSIRDKCHNKIGQTKIIETYLNKEVLLFKDNNQEVIEENKEIEELNDTNYNCEEMSIEETNCYNNLTRTKLNEVIRAVNKINKQLEELEPSSEISEEEINDAIKRARDYIGREEK